MSEQKSFWSTIPGVITGTATVITAVLGLLSILRGGSSTPTSALQSPQTSPSPSASPSPSTTDTPGSSSTVQAEARVTLTPRTVDFGTHAPGQASDELSVTLTNSGTREVVVQLVEVAGADASLFEITQDGCQGTTVQPSYDCQISLRFTPRSVGEFRATLDVEHDGPNSPAESSLRGTGVLLKL
jgi:hypothetical protein